MVKILPIFNSIYINLEKVFVLMLHIYNKYFSAH